MKDYVHVKSYVSYRELLLSIVDGLIGGLVLAAVLVMSGGILYMLH